MRGLTDGLVPDRAVIGTLRTYKGRTPLWRLEFDREALTQGEIEYDRDERSLTIRGLPDELARELSTDLRGDA